MEMENKKEEKPRKFCDILKKEGSEMKEMKKACTNLPLALLFAALSEPNN